MKDDFHTMIDMLIRADCGHWDTSQYSDGTRVITLYCGADEVSMIFCSDGMLTEIGE